MIKLPSILNSACDVLTGAAVMVIVMVMVMVMLMGPRSPFHPTVHTCLYIRLKIRFMFFSYAHSESCFFSNLCGINSLFFAVEYLQYCIGIFQFNKLSMYIQIYETFCDECRCFSQLFIEKSYTFNIIWSG